MKQKLPIQESRFEAACFLIGKPLYADRLVRDSEQPTSYVAGSRNGILTATRLDIDHRNSFNS